MEQNLSDFFISVAYIFIGAIITLLSQIVVQAIKRKGEIEDKKNEHKWFVEDKETDLKKKILLDRLENITNLVNDIFVLISELLSQVSKFANNETGPQEISKDISTIYNKLQYLYAMTLVINDNELNKLLIIFRDRYGLFATSIFKVINCKVEDKKANLLNKVGGNYGTIQEPFIGIIKRIDQISFLILSAKY